MVLVICNTRNTPLRESWININHLLNKPLKLASIKLCNYKLFKKSKANLLTTMTEEKATVLIIQMGGKILQLTTNL